MPQDLPEGVAVVTGAAGGMGSACARLMAEAGWPELLLCDLDEARLDTVAAPLRAAGTRVATLAADVTAPSYDAQFTAALGERPIAALIPVVVARSTGSPSSIARMRACARCCGGPKWPNQPSFDGLKM